MLLAIDPLVVLVGAGVVAALVAAGWWFSPYHRTLRAIRGAPRVRVADAPEGQLVRIVGTLRAHQKELAAPLSRRACAHYEVVVEQHVQRGKHSRWEGLLRESASTDFVIEDPSGRAIVETRSLEVALVQDHHQRSGTFADASPELESILARHGHSSTNFLGFNRTLRYREGVLEPGEEVSVLGWARWEDDPEPGAIDAARGGYREPGRKKRLVIHAAGGPVRASDDPAALS